MILYSANAPGIAFGLLVPLTGSESVIEVFCRLMLGAELTVVVAVLLSFPETLSKLLPFTEAVLLTEGKAPAVTATVRVIVEVDAPTARLPALVQVTFWLTALQLQLVPVADTYVKPEGKVSVTTILPGSI